MNNYVEILASIRDAKIKKGLSNNDLSKLLGVERSCVIRQLYSANINLQNFINMANVLGLKITLHETNND